LRDREAMGRTPHRTSQPAGGQGPAQLRAAERSADNVPAAGMVQPLKRPRPCRPKCRRRRETEAAWLEPGRTKSMTRRMGQLRGAEALGGRRGTASPNAPPQLPGQGAAGACVSLCWALVDGAVLLRCSPLPGLSPRCPCRMCVRAGRGNHRPGPGRPPKRRDRPAIACPRAREHWAQILRKLALPGMRVFIVAGI
jgi:hypothetical protein